MIRTMLNQGNYLFHLSARSKSRALILCISLRLFPMIHSKCHGIAPVMAYLKLFSLMALTIIQSIALSTPIQPSLNTTAVVPITPPHLPPNTSLNTDLLENLTAHGRPVCTDDPQWQLPGDAGAGIYTSACFLALRQMGIEEYIISTPKRFLSATSTGSYEEITVLTPKRYVYNRKTQFQTVKADGPRS